MEQKIVEGQKSWVCATPAVSAAVTVLGAMVAPVTFTMSNGKKVEPYYLSPWRNEDPAEVGAIEPPVLRPLRGDFFCLPFGGDNNVGDEHHLPHGEAAYAPWVFQSSDGRTNITLALTYSVGGGSVTRELRFGEDAPWILSTHTVSGFSGAYPLGTHATLHGGDTEGIWALQTSPFDLGMVDPHFEAPAAGGEYSALKPGATFQDLGQVLTRWKDPDTTDCSSFPARPGFVDIAAIFRRRAAAATPSERAAWTVAINREERYLWYTIKDAALLPATVLWMENRGRHEPPWSGRNSCIGIEEVCGYLAAGRKPSIAPNTVSEQGIATAVDLVPEKPTKIATVQGVIPLDSVDITVTGLVREASGTPQWKFQLADGTTLPVHAPVDEIL